MKRIEIKPRVNYKEIINELGFHFDANYWLENGYYEFTSNEITELETASNECYNMCVEAVEYVIKNNLWDKFHIPSFMVPAIINSWDKDDLSLYGRFDFTFINGVPKLLEFNADTPTSLFEASVVQWNWKEELFPNNDQFNSIHEALIQSFKDINDVYGYQQYDFACIMDNLEDSSTTSYLASTANEAGLNTSIFDISQIGYSNNSFYHDYKKLNVLFKLYPYEWMFNEEFGKNIPNNETIFLEPLWKSIMSNKYILVILSELFPNSKYILKASDKPLNNGNYCKKPIFSREGANVTLLENNVIIDSTDGEYGEEGFIYQELVNIEAYDNNYPVIGSWIIGGESCGIGIRETKTRITNNMSNFVPHIII